MPNRYDHLDINSKLIWNLRDIGHTLHSTYEGRGSQSRVLIVLQEIGSITQSDLTQRLGIQPGSASEVLAKLEAAGMIVRTASPHDRRTTDVRLTEAGLAAAAVAKSAREERHERMFACLSDAEKAELLALLERLNGAWEELACRDERGGRGRHRNHGRG